MATTSDVIEHEGDYERDTFPPTGKGKRGRSADIMASLEARLRRVELAMADDWDKVVDMDQRLDGIEGGHEEFHTKIRGILNSLAESWKAQMDALKDSLQAEIAAIKEEVKEVKGDWSLCKMAVTQGKNGSTRVGGMATSPSCHVSCATVIILQGIAQKEQSCRLLSETMRKSPTKRKQRWDHCDCSMQSRPRWAKSKAPRKGRMYVEAKVRGFTTRALIDTGASHNFMEVKEAKRLGLQFKEEEGWVKAVNTEARPIYGVAWGVRLHIGEWCGQVDFTVVPMDDYPIVLGMEFLDGVREFPILFAETMCIMGEGSACMVPLAREALKSKTLFAMQLYKEDPSTGEESSAKIHTVNLTKSQGASESAKGWHADMAKAAKRRKKRAGKNWQMKTPNSKPNDSRDNPRGRDNLCHGSSRWATSTPKESPYGNSGTRLPNSERWRRGRRQIGWGRMLQTHSIDPKIRPMEGQSSKQSLEPSRPFMRLPEAWR
ncbi:hypothetical protein Acr_15g0005970 [Actinidia rufa]|uniref:Uncharacterized protein n=1 Tax=Actinidia rufa TaxID=165716 RepID=A0A7J0FVM6_9ERIC|nr:hypothetical protein Acr_15g0005970 [Actinidia rufa]